MKTENSDTDKLYKLTIFMCDNCRQRGIPVDGFGVDCHECKEGQFDTMTPASQTVEMPPEAAEEYADCVIEEV